MRNGLTATVLVDTNILAYVYDVAEAVKRQRAEAVVERLSHGDGALSVQVVGELYWTLTHKLRPRMSSTDAGNSVQVYLRTWPVYPLTAGTVAEAVRGAQRNQFPYWDALIWATAKLNNLSFVFSEDFNDGALIEGVRFRNPLTEKFDLAELGLR